MPTNEQIIEAARKRLMPQLVRSYVDSRGDLATTHEVFFRDSVHVADYEAEAVGLEPKQERVHEIDACDDCMKIAVPQYERGYKDGTSFGQASSQEHDHEESRNVVEEYDRGFKAGKASLKPLDTAGLRKLLRWSQWLRILNDASINRITDAIADHFAVPQPLAITGDDIIAVSRKAKGVGVPTQAAADELATLFNEHFSLKPEPQPKRERITVTPEQEKQMVHILCSGHGLRGAVEHVLNEEKGA